MVKYGGFTKTHSSDINKRPQCKRRKHEFYMELGKVKSHQAGGWMVTDLRERKCLELERLLEVGREEDPENDHGRKEANRDTIRNDYAM